jgi:hypothetical protein
MVDCAPPFGSALARVTLVALGVSTRGGPKAERVVLVDKLVNPSGRTVTDYKTHITGLTEADFGPDSNSFLSIEAAQAAILKHVSRISRPSRG